ncbi:MAG: hypothetical protein ACYTKD_23860 [Planctomycetota bacterium]|jgi:hypothetical protein
MLRRRGQDLFGGMRRPVLSAGVCLALAAAALLSSGCAGTIASPAVDSYAPAGPQARPVADLSAAQLDLANFFMGFGLGHIRPEGSSLESSLVYDLSMALDAPPAISVEMLVGLWNLPDRPRLETGAEADSELEMIPVLVALQMQKEFAKFRAYVAPGVGYSFNNYALGANHAVAELDHHKASTFAADVDDSLLYQAAVGVEFYSSESADLNFGMELRYVMGGLDITERPNNSEYLRSVDLQMWLIRGNVTWHF